MKFLEQVKSYQSALTRKSRFFSLLMLVSGISLVAAAPFLSYEVSKLECHEKGSAPSKIGDNEMLILKNDWKRKNQKITDLESSIKGKDDKITELINDANCDDVIRVIQIEKSELEVIKIRLEKEIEVIEKEKSDCRDELIKCQLEKEVIISDGKDCSEAEKERDNWKEKFEKCEEEKEVIINGKSDCSTVETERDGLIVERDRLITQYADCKKLLDTQTPGTPSDCSKVELELEGCKQKLVENSEIIIGLQRDLESCKSSSKISISGTFNYDETFVFNNNKFIANENLEAGSRFRFEHNDNDVTSKLKVVKRGSRYTFSDNNNRYRIIFGEVGKTSVKFQLSSI